jgi:hypothetical protein
MNQIAAYAFDDPVVIIQTGSYLRKPKAHPTKVGYLAYRTDDCSSLLNM